MNRRSFIGSLIAGVVAPAFLPGAGRKWIKTESGILKPKRAIINPEWVNAPFEFVFYWDKTAYTTLLHPTSTPTPETLEGFKTVQDPWPVRCAQDGKTVIPPFIYT